MRHLQVFSFCAMLCAASMSSAQLLAGSSSLDIDPSTNMVTATCETDNDDTAYEASIRCVVYDDYNNQVAQGVSTDTAEQGYAQVVVSFQGEPGTNYTVQAIHNAVADLTENEDEPQGQAIYYDDPYNYSYFNNAGDKAGFAPYPGYHQWEGPGPDTQVKSNNIHVGNTTVGGATIPNVTIKFFGNKSAGDNLMFSAGNSGICSENLGYVQCSSPYPDYLDTTMKEAQRFESQ